MKINRWILVPLIFAIFYTLWMLILGQGVGWRSALFLLVSGAVMGLLIQYISYTTARRVSKDKDARAYDVYQTRNLVVLTDYETAFNFCREAVSFSLTRGKIKDEDFQNGKLKAVNRIGLGSYWATIDFNLKKINENLTEIEFFISPVIKTQMVSDGKSWLIAESIYDYIKQKDTEINKKVLADSVSIMEDVYVKPFQKKKVEK